MFSSNFTSCVCTLFEGNYHHGVAALSNSLFDNGFRGSIFIGYRGELPSWAFSATDNKSLNWFGAKTFTPQNDFHLHFLPINTSVHFANYKPAFILELIRGPARNTDSIFYLDPDIVVICNWKYFIDWVKSGVALSEDINSPLPVNHPRRVYWRDYFNHYNRVLTFKEDIYVNSGFVGLRNDNLLFIEQWNDMIHEAEPIVGNLTNALFLGQQVSSEIDPGYHPFSIIDQDVLNASIEASDLKFSLIGKEGMGFKYGNCMMAHAISNPKPWNWPFFKMILKARAPTLAIKCYWYNVDGLIKPYNRFIIFYKKSLLLFASFIGRFYSRT
jgi:hypothetical protein